MPEMSCAKWIDFQIQQENYRLQLYSDLSILVSVTMKMKMPRADCSPFGLPAHLTTLRGAKLPILYKPITQLFVLSTSARAWILEKQIYSL